MRVKIELTIDVGENAHAEAVSYFIHQYEVAAQDWATVEPPSHIDAAEGVESVVIDLIEQGYEFQSEPWQVVDSYVRYSGD